MTQEAINEAIGCIKSASEKACVSKEAAIQFLKDAGIWELLDNEKNEDE